MYSDRQFSTIGSPSEIRPANTLLQSNVGLLISLRSLTEAKTLLRVLRNNVAKTSTDVDSFISPLQIVDLKEPNAGSLGCCDQQTLAQVSAISSELAPIQLSLALGETHQWAPEKRKSLPRGFRFAKAGPSLIRSIAALRRQWTDLAAILASETALVAVSYADYQTAQCPAPESILEIATAKRFNTLLIDTYGKDRGGIFDHLSLERIAKLRAESRKHGIRLVLAGSLGEKDLPAIASIGPDIIGIRGAVCADGNRVSGICESRLSRWLQGNLQQRAAENAAFTIKP